MTEFKDMLKFFRNQRGLSQSELAKKLGLSPSTISMYEVGKREPDFETEEKIADFFNISLTTLRGKSEELRPSHTSINVLGHVAAGIPIEEIEDVIDTEEISESLARSGEFFGLKVKGDSMEPRILNGDYVIVRQQNDAESGDIVIVEVNNKEDREVTCKKLVKYDSSIALVSLNNKYEPMMFTNEEIEKKPVKIIGKVVEFRGKL